MHITNYNNIKKIKTKMKITNLIYFDAKYFRYTNFDFFTMML